MIGGYNFFFIRVVFREEYNQLYLFHSLVYPGVAVLVTDWLVAGVYLWMVYGICSRNTEKSCVNTKGSMTMLWTLCRAIVSQKKNPEIFIECVQCIELNSYLMSTKSTWQTNSKKIYTNKIEKIFYHTMDGFRKTDIFSSLERQGWENWSK